ncbi:MAG: phage tail assembly chaperone [Alphaproteobacteria bacterium]|nr:phage tail assembly chaperone [Alphaproteobacteria bacterium]
MTGGPAGKVARAVCFPWQRLMELGFGLLALSPHSFWAMTPSELVRALYGATALGMAQPAAPAPLARRDLHALMEAFPDA